jgi:oxygen-independent coproporphyrinogen-3 oxidase
MGEQGVNLLNQQGFERYEVSAFGRVPSKHNLNYWEFGDYIGIGAGAHGKITNIETGKIFRTMKPKSPKDYLGDGKKTLEVVDNLSFEFMLNALRLKNGFKADLFMTRTGQSVDCIRGKLDRAQSIGLLEDDMNVIIPTKRGFDFLNDLQALFL